MYLVDFKLQNLMAHIRETVTNPVSILGIDWNVIGCTHPDKKAVSIEIAKQCVGNEAYEKIALANQSCIYPCSINETLICYILFFHDSTSQKSEQYIPYIRTLVGLTFQFQNRDQTDQSAANRMFLVNQLSSSGSNDKEIPSLITNIGYSSNVLRCAIIFEAIETDNMKQSFDFNLIESQLISELYSCESFSKEDIYGVLNPNRYVIFKALSSVHFHEYKNKISEFIINMSSAICQRYGISLNVSVGSGYAELLQLNQSYKEALFLNCNFEYLNENAKRNYLFINNYIFEYMTSLLPTDYLEKRFKDYSAIMDGSPLLMETLMSLSQHDNSLIKSSKSLGIHRNTMLQRFSKLKTLLDIDPLYDDKDRMKIREFALYYNRKTVLHAGITIQQGSVLHRGLQKFEELVREYSKGSISINTHILEVSGNNHYLLELLRTGSIDFAAFDLSILDKYTNGRSTVLELPYLFESEEQAEYLLNGLISNELSSSLYSAGVECLNIWSMGWRYLSSNDMPVRTPSDMREKKMRIMYSKNLMAEYYRSLGAIPIQMNYGDVSEALESGFIDCQENPYTNILDMKFYRYQKYISEFDYLFDTSGLWVSQATLSKLPHAQQELIRTAASDATKWVYNEQKTMNRLCREKLISDQKITVIKLSSKEQQLWLDAAKPLYDNYAQQEFLQKILLAKEAYHAQE